MPTKYQRPAGVYSGQSALSNRTKYQNDASAQPKVAIASVKVDGDFNYLIDALNEIDVASGTRGSIDERLGVSLNTDGTLKATAVATIDDWVSLSATGMTRLSDLSFSLNGSLASLLVPYRRLRLQSVDGLRFGSVLNATQSAGVTIVALADLTNPEGVPTILPATLIGVSYGALIPGASGNLSTAASDFTAVGTVPHLVLNDTSADGKMLALRSQSGQMQFVENTGTRLSPTWVVRASVGATGLTLADGSIGLPKLENGTALGVMGYNAGGVPSALTVGGLLTNSGTQLSVEVASQAEAEAGTSTNKVMTPQGVAQAIAVLSSAASSSTDVTNETATGYVRPDRLKYSQRVVKAWVNFAGGSATIRDSFNVSSVTRNSTGDYTVSFTTALSNSNYTVTSFVGDSSVASAPVTAVFGDTSSLSTGSVRFKTTAHNGSTTLLLDCSHISIVIVGDL
jgi:hypothetical protein